MCRFRGSLDGEIICDYIQISGKSRIARIAPEDRDKPCQFFERGRKVMLKFKPVTDSTKQAPRFRFDQRKMRALYDQGLSDHQIAREMGCTDSGVKKFRERNKLAANYKAGGGRVEDPSLRSG